jgi:cell division protein FtsB
MNTQNLLRKQVLAEIKKRRLVYLTVIILSFVYLSISIVFGDMGLLKYFEIKETKNNLEKQIIKLSVQNEQLKTQIKLIKEDPFYREKVAREEFGLAKPDEYIFHYEKK